ncbi:Mif2/CENP-C like-domain-containing protein [Cerioporus squamosus]|nr:Mif2/CENP-C like-domain-containing protein [Cerioporus squamosus]
MPAASARKSSIGSSRRGPQKYIPYRADDFEHGKKTGIAVGIVDTTDEFEPFEKVMSQADQRTPFRPQGTRKKRGPKTPVPVRVPSDDEDEDGEMSMELDNGTPHGPSAYFAHTRVNTITSSVQRVGSSSRPVAHMSDVDFDDVPSPRASPSFTTKRSLANGNASRTSLPSRLSHSSVYRDDDDDSDGYAGPPMDDYGDYGNDMDESPPPPPPHGSRTPRNGQTPRRTSFAHLDQEADEQDEAQVEEEMEDYRRSPSEKARGKQPMVYQDDEQEMEPEIAQGFDNLDQQPMDEEPPEEEEAPPPKKGKRGREEKASKNSRKENDGAPRGRQRQKKVVLREATPDDPNTDGLRRSKRRRYSPLAWWRLEKVVYGRRENGQSLVPSIKEIHRIPQMPAEPLGARRRRGQSRKNSRTVEPEAQQVLVYNPEEGWDEKTDSRCLVREYGDEDKEVERRVAFTANMVQPKPAAQGAFYFQKIFGDGDFLAAGQLIIPPGSTKPTKGTKDNTFVFYVIQGAVQFCVHKTNFVLSTGGMFMVPRGNIYYIQNICDRDAKLFFAQARKMPEEAFREEEGEAESDHEERSRSKSTTGQRRQQSTGRASSDTVQGEEPEPKSKRRGTSAR